MDSLPSDIYGIILSLLDDTSRLKMRLASTRWFDIIRYDDFKFKYTTSEQLPYIFQRLKQYKNPIGISFQKSKCSLTKQDCDNLGQLVGLTKLHILKMITDVPVQDMLALRKLTNLEDLDCEFPAMIMRHLLKLKKIRIYSADHAEQLQLSNFSRLEEIDWDEFSDETANPLLLVPNTQHVTRLIIDASSDIIVNGKDLKMYPKLKEFSFKNFDETKRLEIPHLPYLETLSLIDHYIGDLSHLHRTLTSLVFMCERSDHLGALAKLTNLRSLKLSWTFSDTSEFQFLTALTNLEKCRIASVTEEDSSQVLQRLPANITNLVLESICKLQHITKFGKLESLETMYSLVPTSELESCSQVTTLTKLAVEVSPESFPIIERMTYLKKLNLSIFVNYNGDDTIFLQLQKLTALEEFSFFCPISDYTCIDIAQIWQLQLKTLEIVPENGEFFEYVTKMTTLENLRIQNSRSVDEQSIAKIASLSRLRSLTLADANFWAVKSALTLLTSLNILFIYPLKAYDGDEEAKMLLKTLPRLHTCLIK